MAYPSSNFRSTVSRSARISRSRACRAAVSCWRVRARRQAAEQTVWQTGQRRGDPTTGVRTLSGGTLGSGVAAAWVRLRASPLGRWPAPAGGSLAGASPPLELERGGDPLDPVVEPLLRQ